MNAVAAALLLCVLQVTALSLLTVGVYASLRRFGSRTGVLVLLTSLALVAGLTLLAFSPWPRWTITTAATPTAVVPAPATNLAENAADSQAVSPPAGSETSADAAPQDLAGDVPQPSAGLFLQQLLQRLSRAPVEHDVPGYGWSHVVIAIIATGLLLGLARLAAGVVAVRHYRRQGRPIHDGRLTELLDLLQAESGCRRRPEMRESDAVSSAATVGWRQPVVLLPSAWRQWTDAQLRVVLGHELAHIRSNDYLAGFLGQIALALHFYHPLVHWLMARLRLEQELAADSLAAGLSGGRRAYLTILAEMALHKEDQNVGWPARAFLPAKTTFLRRIAMLRNSRFRVTPVPSGVGAAAVAVMLLIGVLVAGLRPPASRQALASEPAEEASSLAPPSNAFDFSYVPEDALIVMAVRPSFLFERMKKIGLGELFREATEPNGPCAPPLRGIHLEATEQLVSVTWKFEPASTEYPQMPRRPVKLYIVRSLDPNRFEELTRIELPDAVEKSYRGQSYLVSPGLYPGAETCCFRPDDRTIVVFRGEEPGIRQVIDSGPGQGPAILSEEGRRMVAGDLGVALADAGRLHDLAQAESQQGRGGGELSVLTSTVMLPDVTSMVVGLNVGNCLHARALFTCKSEAVAAKVKDGLDALRTLGRNFAENSLPATAYGDALRPGFLALLDRLETGIEGSTVRGNTVAPIPRKLAQQYREMIRGAVNRAKHDRGSNNLKLLALAMHVYHDKNHSLPPAVLYGPDGKTPYSWRVAILPLIGSTDLYQEYRFDEPWDGPNNRKLIPRMPDFFRNPLAPANSTNASYFVLTGPGTAFDAKEGRRFQEIRDGTSNTLLLVEAKRDIPWTKPEDIPYDPEGTIPEFGGFSDKTFSVALCDSSVHVLPDTLPEKTFRTLAGRADGTPIKIQDFSIPEL